MKRPKISIVVISDFLKDHYPNEITEVELLEGGESSQAFAFMYGEQSMIIRINESTIAFKKDKYSYENFTSPQLPIPRIIEIGEFNNDYFFAISERAHGVTIDKLGRENEEKVLPNLIFTLDEIHKININGTSGYGDLDETGMANFSSWRDYILNLNDEESYGWSKLDRETFFEKEIIDKSYKRVVELVEYCPEDRFLVHGDYGSNNVIADGEIITGVLDWAGSKYGDFVYDVAWLDFWSKDIKYADFFEEHYRKKYLEIPNYNERIACYKLQLGTGALGFFAHSNQKEKYDFTIKLVRRILQNTH